MNPSALLLVRRAEKDLEFSMCIVSTSFYYLFTWGTRVFFRVAGRQFLLAYWRLPFIFDWLPHTIFGNLPCVYILIHEHLRNQMSFPWKESSLPPPPFFSFYVWVLSILACFVVLVKILHFIGTWAVRHTSWVSLVLWWLSPAPESITWPVESVVDFL